MSLATSDSSAAVCDKPRVIVTTDGEIDDECSMVRFLLYANEFDVEAIVTSSSQYHWQGHRWAGDDWIDPLLDAYAKVHPNLKVHDAGYPTREYLRSRTALGNVKAEGDMEAETAGSQLIVKVLLDESDVPTIAATAFSIVRRSIFPLTSSCIGHPPSKSQPGVEQTNVREPRFTQ